MPQIPVYGGQQIATAPLRPAFQSTPDVSSGTRALAAGLNDVADAADRIQKRDDEARANQIDAEVGAGWLQWDAENRRKYQGQNAGDYQAAAADWWKKTAETYGKDLSPGARQMVSPALMRKQAAALGAVSTYIGAEKERWADDQSEAAAHTTIDLGVDTDDTTGAAARVRQLVAEKGARKGWSTEQVQADQQRLLGTLHLAYITRTADSDPTKAQAYYDANKGEIPAAVQAKVETMLKGETDNQFAQQFAAKHAGLPLADQLAKAGDIADPERRKKTLATVRENYALVKAAQQERESAAADEAWQLVGQGKRVPESVLIRMDGRARVQLQEHLADRARAAANRDAVVKTDWNTYIDLREKLAAGEKVDLRPYAGTKIGPAQMEQLLDIQTKVVKDKEVATSQQQLSAYAAQLKLPKDTLGMFQSAAQAEFDAFKASHSGRLPSFKERQEILDRLVMERDNEWWQFSTKRAFEMSADERAEAKLKPSSKIRSESTAAMTGPVRVDSVEEARALPKGTRFIDPQGIERIR